MSIESVRLALNAHYVGLVTTTVDTVDENKGFKPTDADRPYEVLTLLPGSPENASMGTTSGVWRSGIFAVSLYYPVGQGAAAAAQRAQAIAARFARGTTLTSGSVTVKLIMPVDVKSGRLEAERYHLPVQIPFLAYEV